MHREVAPAICIGFTLSVMLNISPHSHGMKIDLVGKGSPSLYKPSNQQSLHKTWGYTSYNKADWRHLAEYSEDLVYLDFGSRIKEALE